MDCQLACGVWSVPPACPVANTPCWCPCNCFCNCNLQMEEEGVPSTTLREISLLQMLSESNHIVK